jgi:hypothetical protein
MVEGMADAGKQEQANLSEGEKREREVLGRLLATPPDHKRTAKTKASPKERGERAAKGDIANKG